MPTFAVNNPWAEAGAGVGNGLAALFGGEAVRQRAEQDAMLKGATMYAHQQAGNKYGVEAALLAQKLGLQQDPLKTAMIENQVPLDRQPAVQSYINTGSFGPTYEAPADGVGPVPQAPVDPAKMALLARSVAVFNKAAGLGGNPEQMAKMAEIEQTMRDRANIAGGGTAAMPIAQAYAATSGKMPFDSVGNTGRSVNGITGEQLLANPALAQLFDAVQQSRTGENNAQAGAASASAKLSDARRERVETGLDKPVTIVDNGQASVVTLPTAGGQNVVGIAAPKGTGVDATNAKTRNAVIAAIEKEMPGLSDEKFAAEVSRRLARRGLDNKSPASTQPAPKIQSQSAQFKSADDVKAAFKSGSLTRDEATAILQRDFGMK